MPENVKKVLQQLALFGYTQIESYEGNEGIFWGLKPAEFKSYLDSLGLSIVSSHCDISKEFERKAAEAASIGMKYLICPSIGAPKTADDYKRFADEFNKKGVVCKQNGIRFAYHNHDYSFIDLGGLTGQDILMRNTDPSLVDFEMDVYWVVTANQNPVEWINKYPNRFTLFHYKDRIRKSNETEASCTLGEGSINFEELTSFIHPLSNKYIIVEQERFDGTNALNAANANAQFLKRLKY